MHLAGVKSKVQVWLLPPDWPAHEVRVVWSRRRSVALRFHPSQGVELRVPLGVTDAEARRFLALKKKWLTGQIHRHQAQSAHFPPPPAGSIYLRGTLVPVLLVPSAPPTLTGSALHLDLRGRTDALERRIRALLRTDLFARIEAVFAAHHACDPELPLPSKVTIRRMKSRWGSCSPDMSMRFNEVLAHLDDRCLRYVVCHEWSHVRHFNHGEEFYQLLSTLLPNHRADERHLQAHAPALLHPIYLPSEAT